MDLTNLSQSGSVGSLAVGEAGLIISRYAAGVMRVSGQLRTDGVVNSITGFQVNGTPLAAAHLSDGVVGTGRVVKESGAVFATSPTAPTPPANDNSAKLATTQYVDAAVALVGGGAALPPGVILPYGGTVAPAGFLMCDGSAVSRTTYAALFNAIGTNFGPGDGSTTFNLPPTPGKTLVGKGAAGSTFGTLGAVLGEETHTLSVNEMPAHAHTMASVSAGTPAGTISSNSAGTPSGTVASAGAHTHPITGSMPGTNADPLGDYVNVISGGHAAQGTLPVVAASAGAHTHTFTGNALGGHSHSFTGSALAAHNHTINNTGGGLAHNNIQPSLVVNYIIKT